jgi:flagellar biosynthetic protein FliQ
MVVAIGREAIMTVLMLAGPMLFFALIVGLVISVFQAVTQINEMTLTFVPKILSIIVALLIFLPWMINVATGFARHMFELIPTLSG